MHGFFLALLARNGAPPPILAPIATFADFLHLAFHRPVSFVHCGRVRVTQLVCVCFVQRPSLRSHREHLTPIL